METLSGVFPKPKVPPKRNFIIENRMKVKELQRQNTATKKLGLGAAAVQANNHLNNKPIKLEQKYTIKSKPKERSVSVSRDRVPNKIKSTKSRSRRSRSCSSTSSKTESISSSSTTNTKDSSSQTVDVNDEYFLKDVIIRLPSANVLRQLENEKVQSSNEIIIATASDCGSVDQNNIETLDRPENGKDGIIVKKELDDHDIQRNAQIDKLREFSQKHSISKSKKSMYLEGDDNNQQLQNKLEVGRRRWFENNNFTAKQRDSHTKLEPEIVKKINVPESYRIGELPKYLKDMKIRDAEEKKREALIDRNCPINHVALTNEERLEALSIAQNKYDDLIKELNKLPIASQSRRILQRKSDIDRELMVLDEHIRTFSRHTVYVQLE